MADYILLRLKNRRQCWKRVIHAVAPQKYGNLKSRTGFPYFSTSSLLEDFSSQKEVTLSTSCFGRICATTTTCFFNKIYLCRKCLVNSAYESQDSRSRRFTQCAHEISTSPMSIWLRNVGINTTIR